MRWSTLEGRRVAVLGFGHEGRAALAAFRQRFPAQPLHLFCSVEEAAGACADPLLTIDASPPTIESLCRFDVVIKSPGVSPYQAPISDAIAAGVRLTSGSAIWFAEHPDANTIAVTGTKGKSTTAALIAHLLRSGGHRTALAGNIGLPLLALPEDSGVVAHVFELSSFQTQDFAGNPRVALITNLVEEHLDWHRCGAQYIADKLRILGDRRDHTIALLNRDDPTLARIEPGGDVRWYGSGQHWHADDGAIHRDATPLLSLAGLPLPGRHNAQNLCGALAAIEAAGFDAVALAPHARSFRPLPHRLQTLGTRAGITYINDSIATTPQAALAALANFAGRPVAILIGGFDRGLDWHAFADQVQAQPPQALVTMGANGARIADLLESRGLGSRLRRSDTLPNAFAAARAALAGNGVMLLSPGAPSFGQFRDYVDRGQCFAGLAGFDPATITQIDGIGIA